MGQPIQLKQRREKNRTSRLPGPWHPRRASSAPVARDLQEPRSKFKADNDQSMNQIPTIAPRECSHGKALHLRVGRPTARLNSWAGSE